MAGLVYYRGAGRPSIELWLLDDDGVLIDFSTGFTFEFKLGNPGSAAAYMKATGIAGAAGSGSEPGGVPNIVITFAEAELATFAAVSAGHYTWQLKATSSNLPRYYQGSLFLADIIT